MLALCMHTHINITTHTHTLYSEIVDSFFLTSGGKYYLPQTEDNIILLRQINSFLVLS